jgi:hypothetical protein
MSFPTLNVIAAFAVPAAAWGLLRVAWGIWEWGGVVAYWRILAAISPARPYRVMAAGVICMGVLLAAAIHYL